MGSESTTALASPLQQVDRTFVRVNGKRLSHFAGCDYFRLSSHPNVLAALSAGLKRHGLNVAASRVTTGNHEQYTRLEQELAAFFATDCAVLVSTGYMTNFVVAQAFAGQFAHVLIDERAHSSLAGAARFFQCPVTRFRHRDVEDASRAAHGLGRKGKLILLTDGMFAHDGSVAPLLAYQRALPASAWLLVDDAHGAGLLGRNGRGTPEYVGLERARVIQTITLSKAFGVYGGAILGEEVVRNKVFRSPIFVGSTPLPLPLVDAARASLRILATDRSLARRLQHHTQHVKVALETIGFDLPDTPCPIVALLPRHEGEAQKLKRHLLEAGIYPPLIRYPGGPKRGYFRFVLSSEHSERQVKALLETLLEHLARSPRRRRKA